ncbi:MAG: tetratricopeptide repeat protein, partial [Anaerolineae bacterium]
ALSTARSAVAANPSEAWAYLLLGDAYLSDWQPTQARQAYRQAVAAEPGNTDALQALAWIQQLLGEEEQAMSYYRQALSLAGGSLDVHLALANAYLALGQQEKAIAEYQTAIGLNRSRADAYLALGDLYEVTGELAQAETAYRQAISVHPGNLTGYVALGQILQQQERYDEALAQFRAAAEVDRSMAWPWLMQGNLQRGLGNLEAARAAYQKATSVEPGNPSGYSNLGGIYQREKNYDEALAQYDKALAVFPAAGWVLETRGYSYWGRQMLDEAVDSFSAALAVDPMRTGAYGALASIYKKWSDPRDSARHFEELSQQHPDVPWYAGAAAYIYLTIDAVEEAMDNYERLLTMVPEYADAHYSLATLYERGTDARAAVRHWNTYLALAAGSQYAPEAESRRQALSRIRITSPGDDQAISGRVAIRGSAMLDGFWYYKLEYLDQASGEWRVIGDLHYEPVGDGLLGTWETGGLPAGSYRLRLVVVDQTGQFAPPYEMRVQIVH